MIELLLAGGPFMFATLATSIVTIGIFIWRASALWGKSGSNQLLLNQVISLAESRNYAKAIQMCSSSSSPLAKIMTAALLRANRTEREIRRAVEAAALEELPKVKAGTPYVPQLSNLATLFGLIGTIHGLIISFQAAGSENAATKQAMLSQGIAIAFYNTFFGLTVATMAVVLYLILLGKMNASIALLEKSASALIDAILWHREQPKKKSA